MKAAITGANGLLGGNLARKLLEKGYDVKALYHTDKNALDGLNLETVKGDLLDKDLMNEFLRGVDVIFHAAARISIGTIAYDELYKTNVEGTKILFAAAKENKVKTFIHFSSIHALKQPDGDIPCTENCELSTDSKFFYEKTKAITQKWLLAQKDKGIKIVVLNPVAIIGPYDFKPSLVGEFLIDIMRKKLPALIKGGYDWVDVRDVADAAIEAVFKGRNGESYLIGNKWESLENIVGILENITGEKYKIPVFPFWLARLGLPFLRAWSIITRTTPLYTSESLDIINFSTGNILYDKAKKELDFHPRSLDVTIKETAEWFKTNNNL